MKMVLTPNLPEDEVTVAISAEKIEGIRTIAPPKLAGFPPSMAQHADLQLCHLGEEYILTAPEVYAYYKEALSPFGFKILCGETPLMRTYPGDSAYNIARVGNVAFHNARITDPVALRFFETRGIRFVDVRQGYAKCAVLPIDAESIITADEGIAKKTRATDMEVLKIESGGVSLSGFPYGFLGGAGGKTGREEIYFTGKINSHPSYLEIVGFLQKKSIKIKEGSIPIPIDIGSVIPLMTK